MPLAPEGCRLHAAKLASPHLQFQRGRSLASSRIQPRPKMSFPSKEEAFPSRWEQARCRPSLRPGRRSCPFPLPLPAEPEG